MKRITILGGILILLLSGCALTTQAEVEDNSLEDAREAIMLVVEREFGSANITSIGKLTQPGNEGFIKATVLLEDGPHEFYYEIETGRVSSFFNHANIEGELRRFVSEQIDASEYYDCSLTVSSMPTGKRVVLCGDKDLSDAMSSGSYKIRGNMAFRRGSRVEPRSFDFLLDLFSDVDIKVYLYDNYPLTDDLYKGDPTYEYIKTVDGVYLKGF